ncbi:hypothetical protein CBR_g49530 [Chara braunii]|uniref:Uncharacterized protein n=1 Tax=Chara braunii TaxID=69332 RepID=A0A388M524_CHABU|nr:hypothetical protein CBR_g49530 [Chara braunii]|eukprot:GBG89677.1 hypothetical protein CBR_g49530 [Chara braunii]
MGSFRTGEGDEFREHHRRIVLEGSDPVEIDVVRGKKVISVGHEPTIPLRHQLLRPESERRLDGCMPQRADATDVATEGEHRRHVADSGSRPPMNCYGLRQHNHPGTACKAKFSGCVHSSSTEELRKSPKVRIEPQMVNLSDLRDVRPQHQQGIAESSLCKKTHGDGDEDGVPEGEREGDAETGDKQSSSSSAAEEESDEGEDGEGGRGRR